MNHSGNIKISDGNHLRSSGRNLTVPFSIDIESEGMIDKLVCTGILRLLPGKRLVCSGKWNGLDVVVKFFLDVTDGKRHFAREERGIKALESSGIIMPKLLFRGASVSGKVPLLGLEEITGSEDLREVWEKAESDGWRLDILTGLMTVIAKQHMSGICQEDPHIRNFLLSGEKMYTIDGDAIDVRHIGKPLSEKQSLKNLGLFFAQFYPEYASLIPDAFKAYTSERKWTQSDTVYDCLMKEVVKCRHRAEKDYLKKIFRESTPFICHKNIRRFMICGRTYYDDPMAAFLNNPDAVLKEGRMLKDGNSSTVFLIRLSGRPLVVKRYNMKNMWHATRRSYRQSRAWVSWRNAHLLKSIGVNTPNPVAMMEKRLGPLRSVSYILTEYIDGTDTYHLLNSDKAGEIHLFGLVKQFGELLRRFVSSSISHGDFKATNFIVSDKKLFITDLDAVCKHRLKWRFQKAFMKDLDRLMQNWKNAPHIDALFRDEISKIKRRVF
ncbi:MAG: lipopolysaccharide kinase InaA family protein [Desulfobacterales bacterium]|nr:lipopolysaccharide kinase InaA family protein [Desulfobacterales bacterium]